MREERIRGETGTWGTREHEGHRAKGKVDEPRGLKGERGEERLYEQQGPAGKSERGPRCKLKEGEATKAE